MFIHSLERTLRTQSLLLAIPILAFVTLSSFCSGRQTCTPGTSESLNVTGHPQETELWCWAASAQTIMHYLGENISQCRQTGDIFPNEQCPCDQCGPGRVSSPPCEAQAWPPFEAYGFSSQDSESPLSWTRLKKEISQQPNCGKTPVAFSLHGDIGGHMMVAFGYTSDRGINYLEVYDPYPPCTGDYKLMNYAAYSGGREYTHWYTIYQIRRE